MKILIACETSGVVREAFRALGHDAWSCDLLPADDQSPFHIQGNALELLCNGWDLLIAHPPCTYLSSSGIHWAQKDPTRARKIADALQFVREFMSAPVPRICIENPVGIISTMICKPTQIVQPWQFGDDASKATCFWLAGLPPLVPTQIAKPRVVSLGRLRFDNQTEEGANKLGPSATRWKERSRTYPGIAQAMATQWGSNPLDN